MTMLNWTYLNFKHGTNWKKMKLLCVCWKFLVQQMKSYCLKICFHIYTTLAWDKDWRNSYSTTHRVNGIIVQPKTFGTKPNNLPCPVVQKDKKRSLTLNEDPLPVYVPGERQVLTSEVQTWIVKSLTKHNCMDASAYINHQDTR